MRSACLLIAGLGLIGGGVAVLLSDLPGRWWLGVVLVVAGLLLKIGGFLVTDQPTGTRVGGAPATRNGHHTATSRSPARTGAGPVIRTMPARTTSRVSPSSGLRRRAS